MESLRKEYSQREKNLKVLRALPPEWDMKVVAMVESNDLSKISTFELFSDLKTYEFDKDTRKDKETSSSKVLARDGKTARPEATLPRAWVRSGMDEQNELTLFIRQFKKFDKGGKSNWRKGPSKPTGEGKDNKVSKGSNTNNRKPGHFIKDYPYPRNKKYSEDEKAARAERRKKQDNKRIRALLSELEKSKEASHSSSKQAVEFEYEDSSDSKDNETLICLMVKEEKAQYSTNSSIEKDSTSDMIHSLLILMEDIKTIRSDNETLKEENLLLKTSNE
ncbi:hypothetical protein ACS0TY_028152 [Phlomoides rotata]